MVTSRTQWVTEWPGMVVLCVSLIFWTLEVQEVLREGPKGSLAEYHEKLESQMADIGKETKAFDKRFWCSLRVGYRTSFPTECALPVAGGSARCCFLSSTMRRT